MEKKQLINEIHRNLKLMGLNKDLKIYEDNNTKYRIVLKESLGSIGAEISQFLTRTGRQVFEEVPGLLDQYGNKVTKLFYEFGNYKIADDLFSAFQAVCNGTKKMSDLGFDNAKLLLDIIEDLNPSLITKFYDDMMAQVISGTDKSIDDIIRALKKRVDAGANLEDEVLNMCGGDELLADVLMRTFKTKIDEVVGDSFKGTLEDAIKKAFSAKWGGVIDDLPLEKTIKDYVKSFLASDGWLRQMRALTLHVINGWTKNQDALLQEGLRDAQKIFEQILSGQDANLKNLFRKLNVTLDSVDANKILEIQQQFIAEIKKLDFNVDGTTRKLTEREIKIFQDGFVNNKVFGDDISSWIVDAWNDSYWGKWAKSLFKKTGENFKVPEWLSRTWWFMITTTARNANDWSKIIRTRTVLKEFKKIWLATTLVAKIAWPAFLAFFGTLWDTIKFSKQEDNPESQSFIADACDEFLKQLKEAWAPNDSEVANAIEIIIPIHASPIVKFAGYIDDIRKDRLNMDDITDRLKAMYPDLSDEEIEKYKAWWERNKDANLEGIENVSENLDNLGSSEIGFKSYCQLKGYDFVGWGALSQIGKAQVTNEGLKDFEWRDDVNDFVKTN